MWNIPCSHFAICTRSYCRVYIYFFFLLSFIYPTKTTTRIVVASFTFYDLTLCMLLDNYSHYTQQLFWNSFVYHGTYLRRISIGAFCWRDFFSHPCLQLIWIRLKKKKETAITFSHSGVEAVVRDWNARWCVHGLAQNKPKQRKMCAPSPGKMPVKRVDWTDYLTKQNMTTDKLKRKKRANVGWLRRAGRRISYYSLFLAEEERTSEYEVTLFFFCRVCHSQAKQ